MVYWTYVYYVPRLHRVPLSPLTQYRYPIHVKNSFGENSKNANKLLSTSTNILVILWGGVLEIHHCSKRGTQCIYGVYSNSTYIDYRAARPLLPREVHQLVVGPLEETDASLAEVRADVELVASLVDHLHFSGLEREQWLKQTSQKHIIKHVRALKTQTTKTHTRYAQMFFLQ